MISNTLSWFVFVLQVVIRTWLSQQNPSKVRLAVRRWRFRPNLILVLICGLSGYDHSWSFLHIWSWNVVWVDIIIFDSSVCRHDHGIWNEKLCWGFKSRSTHNMEFEMRRRNYSSTEDRSQEHWPKDSICSDCRVRMVSAKDWRSARNRSSDRAAKNWTDQMEHAVQRLKQPSKVTCTEQFRDLQIQSTFLCFFTEP